MRPEIVFVSGGFCGSAREALPPIRSGSQERVGKVQPIPTLLLPHRSEDKRGLSLQ